MNWINSSQDIMFLAIAICVLVFTFFLCWLLYYTVLSVRNMFKITKDVRDSVDKLHNILTTAKEKLDSTFSYIYVVEEGIKKISDVINDYKKKYASSSNSKTRKKKTTSQKKTNSKK